MAERRDGLTTLDAAIGGGDQGINLDRGFAAAVARLERAEIPSGAPGPLVAGAGRTLTGAVGGASGAFCGRALGRVGERFGPGQPAPTDVVDALEQGITAIAAPGRSRPGEKTMLDTLFPAAVAFRTALEDGADLAGAAVSAALLVRAFAHARRTPAGRPSSGPGARLTGRAAVPTPTWMLF